MITPRIGVGVLTLALGLGACGDKSSTPSATNNRRINAVVADAAPAARADDFCEQHASAAEAKTFTYPALAPGVAAPSGKWRWINLWATWCKPCIEEMPMMARWRDRLRDDKIDADIVFLSVDEGQEVVDRFRSTHPDVPTDGPRMADADALAGWLDSLGLPSNAVLPVHLFVDPHDKLRCVRMGGVSAEDYGAVRQVFAAG